MSEKLAELITDPYEIRAHAPYGFSFLLSADIRAQRESFFERVKSFLVNSQAHKERYNQDYKNPSAKRVSLPKNFMPEDIGLVVLLKQRKSVYNFNKRKASAEQLGYILTNACGLKFSNDPEAGRMYPSGGALYTTRVYVDVRNVEGVSSGLYLYNPYHDSLDIVNDMITDKDRKALQNDSQTIESIRASAFQIFLTIKPSLAVKKYGEHGLKLALIELGHLCQNIWLLNNICGLSGNINSSLSLKKSKAFLRTDPEGEFLLYSFTSGYEK